LGMSKEEFLLRHYPLLFSLFYLPPRHVSGATTLDPSQKK
jgi:hypothetical protein